LGGEKRGNVKKTKSRGYHILKKDFAKERSQVFTVFSRKPFKGRSMYLVAATERGGATPTEE